MSEVQARQAKGHRDYASMQAASAIRLAACNQRTDIPQVRRRKQTQFLLSKAESKSLIDFHVIMPGSEAGTEKDDTVSGFLMYAADLLFDNVQGLIVAKIS